MEEITSNKRYMASLFFWVLLFCAISSIMFYPVNYFTLHFSLTNYFLLFSGIFIGSGILFHRFYSNLYDHVVIHAENQNEKFWDTIGLIVFNLTAPFAGFIIYLYTDSMIYGVVTIAVYFIGGISWYIPLNGIRREHREIQEREEKYNKVFMDEEGNKRLLFKL
ncbi:MAG: hypothetical protein ACQEW2_17750 [Bacillota bacterium]